MKFSYRNESQNLYSEPLTTGETAKVLQGISQTTVIRSFDVGMLKGCRTPGSTFRKIFPVSIRKMAADQNIEHSVPEATVFVILSRAEGYQAEIMELLGNVDEKAEAHVTDCSIDAGLLFHERRPALMLVDAQFRKTFIRMKASLAKHGKILADEDKVEFTFKPKDGLDSLVELCGDKAAILARLYEFRKKHLPLVEEFTKKATA